MFRRWRSSRMWCRDLPTAWGRGLCRGGEAFFENQAKRGGMTTLLVFGGSQGARAINEAMIRCLPELLRQAPGIHIIHQTGERDYNDARAAYRGCGESAEVFK